MKNLSLSRNSLLFVGLLLVTIAIVLVSCFFAIQPTPAPIQLVTLTPTETATHLPSITPPPSITPTSTLTAPLTPSPTHTDPTISPPTIVNEGTLTPTSTPTATQTNSPSVTPIDTIAPGRNKTPMIPVTGLSEKQIWILQHRQ